MRRTDKAYWQRLRKDKRSAAAGLFTMLASLLATIAVVALSVPGPHIQARGNPIYWLAMLPFAWWASALSNYEPIPVRSLWAVQIAAPLVVAAAGLAAPSFGQDTTIFWIATGVATVSSILGAILYRGSMLGLEGPAR